MPRIFEPFLNVEDEFGLCKPHGQQGGLFVEDFILCAEQMPG
jgi:hypothetical protein